MPIEIRFYFWDYFIFLVLYIAYCLAPQRFVSKKHEYVKFVLLFLGLWLPALL